jgi:hypothetical protein
VKELKQSLAMYSALRSVKDNKFTPGEKLLISGKNKKTKLVTQDFNVCLQADADASGAKHMCGFKTR